ncbi:MAG: Ig-like domain-containing protein, partial [bacterium]|nr:Ig-like domain-containing protein [bacterium]
SATRDNTSVTLWTTSGDTETIQLTELFDAQTTVGTRFNCTNNVFWNETPIPVSTTVSVAPAFIRMNPGQTTTFQAAGNPAAPGNGTIDGYGLATAYVVYGSATATAQVICSGAAPFTWQSSDTTIGSIDSTTGVLTANTNGTITITATDANGFSSTATVQILTTDAPMAIETPSIYLHRSELFDIRF